MKFTTEFHVVLVTVLGLAFALLVTAFCYDRNTTLTKRGFFLCFAFDVARYLFFLVGQVFRLTDEGNQLTAIWRDPIRPQIARTLDVVGLACCCLLILLDYAKQKTNKGNHA